MHFCPNMIRTVLSIFLFEQFDTRNSKVINRFVIYTLHIVESLYFRYCSLWCLDYHNFVFKKRFDKSKKKEFFYKLFVPSIPKPHSSMSFC